ncbi:MAG: hypothetical protein U5N85_02565 [Arcicella sp.]|nr:hypothetical protein [Arcicella sp.]
MKKLFLSLIAIISIQQISVAQQPMTISPGLVVSSPTAGNSGLRFSNLNSGTTASTTPTKVLSLDATGNVILGNAASGGSSSGVAVSIPVYANNSARNTAIPTASAGMLVYNSFLGGPEYHNGTSWNPLNLWSVGSTGRITASSGYPNGIETPGLTLSKGTSSTLASPLINSIGSGNVILRFGRPSSTAAVFQESVTETSLGASSINWRYINGASPQVTTNLFGYNAGTFTVNGFTKLGDEATTTAAGVTRSSPAIKTILLTGSLTPRANPETTASLTTTIAHGLNFSKIVNMEVLVYSITSVGVARLVGENCVAVSGYQFSTYTDGTNVHIIRNTTNSSNIGPTVGSSTAIYKILISYIP